VFSAAVFAYSEVGFRCLRELLDGGVRVPLVFTHEDRPGEPLWFGSVAQLARERGIEVVTPDDPNSEAWIHRLARLAPEYVFSFYYRSMLDERLLAAARWAALNMHGSLLPKYRGRAPVNWAILNGETETGATLHHMVSKPDAGPIVARAAVPIGIDDTALTVSMAVAEAAAHLLRDCLHRLAEGPLAGTPMNLDAGSYFGGRTPDDGRIDWDWPAARVHALIRAVAPPFPGAFTDVGDQRLVFVRSQWTGEVAAHRALAPCLYAESDGRMRLDCRDGVRLVVPQIAMDGAILGARDFSGQYGRGPLHLDTRSVKRKAQS
jgi:methionyl-tRNA formyltransferase